LKRSCRGLIAPGRWGRNVEECDTDQEQKQRAPAGREPVAGMVKIVSEDEEDKRSWRVFRGDLNHLVRDIARMALRKNRGPKGR